MSDVVVAVVVVVLASSSNFSVIPCSVPLLLKRFAPVQNALRPFFPSSHKSCHFIGFKTCEKPSTFCSRPSQKGSGSILDFTSQSTFSACYKELMRLMRCKSDRAHAWPQHCWMGCANGCNIVKYIWNAYCLHFIYISHHFTAREDMNNKLTSLPMCGSSQLSWSSIAPVSWRSRVRIPLKP